MAEWVSYESADQPPAEISFDVDFDEDDEFKQSHPYAAIVTASGDSDALFDIGNGIEAALNATGGALVAIVAENGTATLYGYVEDPSQVELARAVTHAGFNIDVRTERDDAWRYYERCVLRGEELERARDVEQLEELREVGASLDAPVDVTFYLEFVSTEALRDALPDLNAAGYAVPEISQEFFSDEGITVVREMILTLENLIAERAKLSTIATDHGGHYDGWSIDEEVVNNV